MTIIDGFDVTLERLRNFHRLALISEKHIERLMEGAGIKRLSKGQFLFRKMAQPDTSYFLLEGEVEIRESFEKRNLVDAAGHQARFPIEEHCRGGAAVRAQGDCVVLTLRRDAIDELIASGDDAGIDVVLVSDTEERLEEARFDDEYSEDWMARLLESPLMSHLSATNIQRCFIELERLPKKAGEDVVLAGSRGEHFYIIVEGEASVITEEAGPYKGQTFDLVPGDYFGEEALVANTIRNATVRMTSDGAVGRLDRAQFDAIFKSSLVQTIDLDKARKFLASAGIGCEIIDVRFPAEYKHAHIEGSVNTPVVSLRKRLRELDRNKSYLVTPEGGRRSELAVYLLRQAGLNAYLLNG
ncbi:MAG: cyclic nucleotide-binding domain-containing protein [Gammaproteobacteria bacterium]|jgi:CRP-like cAMP-binding protein|nr:cyclic nucleotide-binding domain-containing protein [Gammaproteobacteria bacterium]MBP6051431.1 cyclic nucleotide-binding domain-containing protein [Pseudomonadales bacterium]MBK6582796.1 cyclic nucleotide-binding domain-containing protein [Gammaproteobacteria bacterium]MBK7518926.1 cyclic nucleotide-binding domain-containing protein [Gammaproteobacteria bacterium]MBK7730332.1 cyclic nucleotide-binding domain-containing protein [Gammaproteobacteria bacterium]